MRKADKKTNKRKEGRREGRREGSKKGRKERRKMSPYEWHELQKKNTPSQKTRIFLNTTQICN